VLSVRKEALDVKYGRVGVISDTHGLVRAEALAALKGSEVIVHAGDIGKPEVLESLRTIAPVIAIRGNNDRGSWAKKLPDILTVQINGIGIYVIHNVNEVANHPAHDFRIIVSGHSHKPSAVTREGVLFVNPGSAGPRRFKLPVAVARLGIRSNGIKAQIVELKV
jgi:putative phosphoesterase